MKNYKTLLVWQKSHLLVMKVYEVSHHFPNEEIHVITNQMRRAALSIPSNIAEGAGRNSDAEFSRFLTFSLGSANELSYQIYLSFQLKYIDKNTFESLDNDLTEVSKMVTSLYLKLRSKK